MKFGWNHLLDGFFLELQVVIFKNWVVVASCTAVPAHRMAFIQPFPSPGQHLQCHLPWCSAGVQQSSADVRSCRHAVSVARSLVCTVLPGLICSCTWKSFILCSAVHLGLIQRQHNASFRALQRGFWRLLAGSWQQGPCGARRATCGPLALGKANKE